MTSAARDSWYSRHLWSCFLSPADRFSFLGDALLLLPCSLRSLPGSGKVFSIMSHMETLIEAPDGYSLGFPSSSIPSGRSPSPGLSGRVQTLQRLRWKQKAIPSTRSQFSTACRRSGLMFVRSSKLPGMPPSHWGWLCRWCWSHTNPHSRRTAWGWGRGHVLPASCQFTMAAGAYLVLRSLVRLSFRSTDWSWWWLLKRLT